MDATEIVNREEGRGEDEGGSLKAPSPQVPSPNADRRRERLQALWKEIDAHLDPLPRDAWPENDPVIEKFRRKGLLD